MPKGAPFANLLAGGDRRSIGRSDEAVAAVRDDPGRFDELWACLTHSDAIVRMRAADTLEKLSRDDAAPFNAHKKPLINGSLDDGTAEVRWHLVVIAARLALTTAEAKRFCATLDDRLRNDESRIVRVMALQAAFELCARHPALKASFAAMLKFARGSGIASLRARARKLELGVG